MFAIYKMLLSSKSKNNDNNKNKRNSSLSESYNTH